MAEGAEHAACADCVRRSWLLGELSAVLDYNSRADGRLFALLALSDEALIAALGGRRRVELRRRHAEFGEQEWASADAVAVVCRHDARYPRDLLHPGAPHLLYVTGGLERLRTLTAQPVAAFVGCSRPTDYGLELARELGCGLGASGVTVAAGWGGGIARAALAGALEAEGPTVTVAGDGLGVAVAGARDARRVLLEQHGCTVAELPPGVRGRRWGANAAERIIASLAVVAIVVEAEENPRTLAAPRLAAGMGKTLVACPGRVSSRASSGSHLLLREGATLVRSAADVLDLLYGIDCPAAPATRDVRGRRRHEPGPPPAPLSAKLRAVLEQVGAGVDTPGKLTAGSADPGELLQALGELESIGLLRRGDGGRYLACSVPP
jgi:predicted Rossmann fold nucleotide-binding protein DprA/Smf involved in DNA uptake